MFKEEEILSQSIRKIMNSGSEIRRMFLLGLEEKKKNPTLDIIDLSLGNPDLEPPAEVHLAIAKVLTETSPGQHRYMDNAGYQEVRSFLAKELSQSEKVPLTENSVFFGCGAAGALQIILRTVLDPGDEVIIFAPYFVEYVHYINNYLGKTKVVGCDEKHLPNLQELKNSLGKNTKAIIINSPNNPTGVLYSENFLKEFFKVLTDHREKTGQLIHVISDEPYARLAFKGLTCPSLLSLYDATWIVRSHSKDLGLAGERIGYAAWRQELGTVSTINALRNAARALGFVNAPALMQRILPSIYHCRVNIDEYESRVRKFVEKLRSGGMSVEMPGGGFFVFPKAPCGDGRDFCEKLMKKGVLCVPGLGFGASEYFRVSLTQPSEKIEDAASRILSCL